MSFLSPAKPASARDRLYAFVDPFSIGGQRSQGSYYHATLTSSPTSSSSSASASTASSTTSSPVHASSPDAYRLSTPPRILLPLSLSSPPQAPATLPAPTLDQALSTPLPVKSTRPPQLRHGLYSPPDSVSPAQRHPHPPDQPSPEHSPLVRTLAALPPLTPSTPVQPLPSIVNALDLTPVLDKHNKLLLSPGQTISQRHLSHHRLPPALMDHYTLGDELGSGGYGFVLAAQRSDGLPVAVKFIFKDRVPRPAWVLDDRYGLIPTEAHILRQISHPAVIGFVDLFQDRTYVILIMELHGSRWNHGPDDSKRLPGPNQQQQQHSANGAIVGHERPPIVRRSSMDLFECIEVHERFTESQAKQIFAQVVDVVLYLDRLGIVHRDIKDENIVIDKKLSVKLIDFGSAVKHDLQQPPPLYDKFYGTVSFAACEILQGRAYAAQPAEVWSLGCLLSILITGAGPFANATDAMHGRLLRLKVFVSDTCLDLMRRCLACDPAKRPTIQEIANHPWLADGR